MIEREDENSKNKVSNLYDDGNIPEIDLPREEDKNKNKNLVTEIELPSRTRATNIIPEEF